MNEPAAPTRVIDVRHDLGDPVEQVRVFFDRELTEPEMRSFKRYVSIWHGMAQS